MAQWYRQRASVREVRGSISDPVIVELSRLKISQKLGWLWPSLFLMSLAQIRFSDAISLQKPPLKIFQGLHFHLQNIMEGMLTYLVLRMIFCKFQRRKCLLITKLSFSFQLLLRISPGSSRGDRSY